MSYHITTPKIFIKINKQNIKLIIYKLYHLNFYKLKNKLKFEMVVCQSIPELRVALIGINSNREIYLETSARWPGFLTVPGKEILHGKTTIEILLALIEEEGLELNLKKQPEFLPPPLEVINPKQFFLSGAHMVFHEYACHVEGNSKNGKFYPLYKILHENKEFYESNQSSEISREYLVEEFTYQILQKYVDHLFRNHQPK